MRDGCKTRLRGARNPGQLRTENHTVCDIGSGETECKGPHARPNNGSGDLKPERRGTREVYTGPGGKQQPEPVIGLFAIIHMPVRPRSMWRPNGLHSNGMLKAARLTDPAQCQAAKGPSTNGGAT